MPRLSQGDIFQAASRVQLAIVFGHVGLNEMRHCWVTFSRNQAHLNQIRDPFSELADRAVEWSPGHWLWFFPEHTNHGMTDAQLADALDTAFLWASRNGIESVATNGVANIDHGMNTADNRRSDFERVSFLKDYATSAEQRYGVSIELISLNDAFIRDLE